MMNERYKCLHMAQKSGISDDWKRYRELRNKVNKALKRAEANYWKKLLSEAQDVSTNFWNIVKQLNKQVKVQNKIRPLRDENNKLVYDDGKKPTIMNIFFATIG